MSRAPSLYGIIKPHCCNILPFVVVCEQWGYKRKFWQCAVSLKTNPEVHHKMEQTLHRVSKLYQKLMVFRRVLVSRILEK